ncbi:hypothetical protein GCM10023193_48020 [Planotetraspora kaengkrachanensis]|uniref:Uncharacterized protein n=1 Tax=Planotetraspora kaengkrachanensis TaxID=575193 RepID=A0A8J3M9H7_9ACTN|nr:hypothetical protein Pka01_38720 [Planotetraspora kaengkrachanensis]
MNPRPPDAASIPFGTARTATAECGPYRRHVKRVIANTCQVQYWNGSAYVAVPGQSACGVAGNTYNVTTFTSVNTTRLRLSIASRTGYSTGVVEWMALRTGS